ncbi:hypothetical protein V1515DRAFT_207098 [Lipomyces mesembrius]
MTRRSAGTFVDGMSMYCSMLSSVTTRRVETEDAVLTIYTRKDPLDEKGGLRSLDCNVEQSRQVHLACDRIHIFILELVFTLLPPAFCDAPVAVACRVQLITKRTLGKPLRVACIPHLVQVPLPTSLLFGRRGWVCFSLDSRVSFSHEIILIFSFLHSCVATRWFAVVKRVKRRLRVGCACLCACVFCCDRHVSRGDRWVYL